MLCKTLYIYIWIYMCIFMYIYLCLCVMESVNSDLFFAFPLISKAGVPRSKHQSSDLLSFYSVQVRSVRQTTGKVCFAYVKLLRHHVKRE